ncbi:MAG TPA: hypothetical protein VEL03_19005 [Streptosporangiaceae bacterium]|nr:hypothetical protein [Streptosporangiaceae bacterium]
MAAIRRAGWSLPVCDHSLVVNADRISAEVSSAPAPRIWSARAAFETGLIAAGFVALFVLLPHNFSPDDKDRFSDISLLLDHGRLAAGPYSLVMPLASVPLLVLGDVIRSPAYWAVRFNVVVTAAGVLAAYRMVRARADPRLFRLVVLVLLFASFYLNRMRDYNAEVFTATLVTLGIICLVTSRHQVAGWTAIVIGVVNTPAAIVGLVLMAVMQAVRTRRLRHLAAIAAAVALIMLEAWIRRGSPLDTGYTDNHGFRTIMPYSGLPGFSYPFLLGLAGILFSFGRGLLFFTPGVFMLLNARVRRQLPWPAAVAMMVLFTTGLILLYARWWAWYGGVAWGPRFFAFAAIPSSIVVAAGIWRAGESWKADALTLGVLGLSAWVGLAGAIADLKVDLAICQQAGYANEQLCWFTPDYSSLWQPVRQFPHLLPGEVVLVIFLCAVYAYLAAPLVASLARAVPRLPRPWATDWSL